MGKVCPERNAPPPIRSHVSNSAYRSGWESTFGKPKRNPKSQNRIKPEGFLVWARQPESANQSKR